MVSCKQEGAEIAENKYVLRLAKEIPEATYIEVTEDSSSMRMNFYLGRDSTLYLTKYFPRVNSEFYERIFLVNFKGDKRDTVDILLLSTRRDTSYQHVYADYGKFSDKPLVSKDYLIKIFSEGDNRFITEKYSPYNRSELVEKFVYDRNYTILNYTLYNARRDTLRFINTSSAEGGAKDLAAKAHK
jgi:hypothetical protein